MIKAIVQGPAKILSEVSIEVTDFSPYKKKKAIDTDWMEPSELYQLVEDLRDTTHSTETGIGLAANQLGSNLRVLYNSLARVKVFINPVVTEHSNTVVAMAESCLSFPDKIVVKNRWERISVRAQGLNGNEFGCILRGIGARIFLHELDHLNGINIVDGRENNGVV